jgi:predicted GNAT family N-acyltransferase
MSLNFKEVSHNSAEYLLCVDLRNHVLRRPLGLTFSPEQLDAENSDIHLAVFEEDTLVGCAILTTSDVSRVKMRQVAVAPEKQGRGIGRDLVAYCELVGLQRGFMEMYLHARATVVPFYEKSGYCTVGEPFVEVGIPHRAMVKNIS